MDKPAPPATKTVPKAEASGPLDGVRVIELATVVAGPGAGRYLADFGAEVIKVEGPGGDPTRRMGWTGPGETDSYFWKLVNRNKQVIALDLKTETGKENLWSLLLDANVLIENMRPGKLEALGFAPDELLRRNPRLVILRITGFGQDGPYAMHPGFATIAEAMSGFSGLLGEAGGPPLLPPIAMTDEVTALVGAFAALAALRHAERTGEGQTVDVNLLNSMFQIMGPLPSAYAHLGYLQPRLGSGIPYTVPRGTYRCADGVWVAISSSSDSVARRVLALIGHGDDPRFAGFQARSQNREALEAYVAAWVAGRPSEEVLREFRRVDAAIAKVLDMKDIFDDEHFRARGMIAEVDGVVMQNVVAGMSKTPGRLRHQGRPFDADTEAVLARFAGGRGAAKKPTQKT
ncbi:CoA transferase [Mesorhizobium sp. M0228]|uniref:CaiB/BaiF CoA transferase family protein n=1 Tax=Mesorhizobium sp. M0228 TaxID=2956923 RepID=UPI00333D3A0E